MKSVVLSFIFQNPISINGWVNTGQKGQNHIINFLLFQAIVLHPLVTEAAVVPIPDDIKGHVPVGICVLKTGKRKLIFFFSFVILKLGPHFSERFCWGSRSVLYPFCMNALVTFRCRIKN